MPFEDLITSTMRRKLSALRLRLRVHLVAAGLGWLAVAVVAGVFLSLGFDYALHMDRAQRGLIVALCLGGIGYVAWRFLLRPLRVPMDPEELALVLESRYPALDDRLISTLQFATRPTSRTGASESLIRKVAQQLEDLVAAVSPAEPIHAARTWKRLGAGLAATVVLAGFAAWQSPLMGLWFRRNVLLAEEAWPKQTYLTVVGGPRFRAVRGEALTVTVSADPEHVVPRTVTFHMRFPGLGTVSENVPLTAPGGHTYVKTFESVTEAFAFYVTGNDDRTGTSHVVVVDPPQLVSAAFTVDYPAYQNRARQAVSAEHHVLTVPPGSRIALAGRTDKDLRSAALMMDEKTVTRLRVVSLARPDQPDAPRRRRGVQGHFQLPERMEKRSLTLRFVLTDTEGITNSRGAVYALRIEPDRAPVVSLARRGVRSDVSARAMLPLQIGARDDHGVAGIDVSVVLPSMEALSRPATTTAPTARLERRFPVPDLPAGRKRVRVEYVLDLRPLKPRVGQFIQVRAETRDALPASFGGPNTARSPMLTFKVVSDEELLADLVRRQKEIRQEFARLVVLQAEVRDRVRGARDHLAGASGVDAGVRRALDLSGRNQKAIAVQCGVLLAQLRGVLDEMSYNRVGEPADRRHLAEAIIRPLDEVVKKPMPDIAEALARASKKTDAGELLTFTSDAVGVLEQLHQRLRDILKEMKQLESRQELASLLKMIIDWSKQVEQAIRERQQKETGTLFRPASRPAE